MVPSCWLDFKCLLDLGFRNCVCGGGGRGGRVRDTTECVDLNKSFFGASRLAFSGRVSNRERCEAGALCRRKRLYC